MSSVELKQLEELQNSCEERVNQYQALHEKVGALIAEFRAVESGEAPTSSKSAGGKSSSRSEAMKRAWETRRAKEGGTTKPKGETRSRAKNEEPLTTVVQKILSRKANQEGLKLAELVDAVTKEGWQTTSTRKGAITQIVYQAVRNLMNQEPRAIVAKDESKRYHLTTDAA